jgi:D-alanyl-D-alanine dipeptidase
MKLYQTIPIIECNELLLPIPGEYFIWENPPPYQKLGADYQGRSPYYLREGVIQALLKASRELARLKPKWKIKIFDAYRPLAVQQFMVDYTFNLVCQQQGLNSQSLADSAKNKIYEQVYQIWAIPSHNPLTPPPHSTGAAVDLTLVDEQDITIDMGGEIDELSPRSQPNYYALAQTEQGKQYHQYRQLLFKIMVSAGFQRHPGEWWHFSLGDQMWAWLSNLDNPQLNCIAKYGRVEPEFGIGMVK